MTTFSASVFVGTPEDPDDELVAVWDAWRIEWLTYHAQFDGDDSAVRALDEKICDMPAHGLRGVAAKAGYTLWHAMSREQKESPIGGLLVPFRDMDWDLQLIVSLARDLERLTGVTVVPTWDMTIESEGSA